MKMTRKRKMLPLQEVALRVEVALQVEVAPPAVLDEVAPLVVPVEVVLQAVAPVVLVVQAAVPVVPVAPIEAALQAVVPVDPVVQVAARVVPAALQEAAVLPVEVVHQRADPVALQRVVRAVHRAVSEAAHQGAAHRVD